MATNVGSGKAVYRQLNTLDYEELEFVRASASMPLVSNIVKLNGQRLLDGGVADSIPLAFFQKQGYQRNVVVLTQPKGYRKQPNKLMPLMHLQLHRHPKMLKALAERHIMYNKEVDLVLQEEQIYDQQQGLQNFTLGIIGCCSNTNGCGRLWKT